MEFKRSTGRRTETARTVCTLANAWAAPCAMMSSIGGRFSASRPPRSRREDVASEPRATSNCLVFPDIVTVTLKGGNTDIARGAWRR